MPKRIKVPSSDSKVKRAKKVRYPKVSYVNHLYYKNFSYRIYRVNRAQRPFVLLMQAHGFSATLTAFEPGTFRGSL